MLRPPVGGTGLELARFIRAAEGYGLVGGVGEYDSSWRMAHVRGPEGIVVSQSQRVD